MSAREREREDTYMYNILTYIRTKTHTVIPKKQRTYMRRRKHVIHT
jgi:hypothetical protein